MSISEDHGDAVNITSMVLVGIVLGIIGLVLTDCIEIISTSFFGSFIVFRVLGLIFGGYPDSNELSLYVHKDDYGSVNSSFNFSQYLDPNPLLFLYDWNCGLGNCWVCFLIQTT